MSTSRRVKWACRWGALLALLASSVPATAQPKARPAERNDIFVFTDDPLSAGGFGPNDVRITMRPGAMRDTLIRPRVSFVQEMLKSVEKL